MLHTEHRPTSWEGFVGNEKAARQIQGVLTIHAEKLAKGTAKDGLAFQITGLSGAGKTTLAQLIARHVGAGPDSLDYAELDGDKCGADAVRNLEQAGGFFCCRPWGKAKCLIVNESHGMTPKAVQAWLTLLERLPKWAVVVFTSTESPDVFGNFAGPFARRCVNVALTNQGLAGPFAQRLVDIAKQEGYELPHKAALSMVQAAGNNLGMAIEALGAFLADRRAAQA